MNKRRTEWRDQVFYTAAAVEAFLPAVFDPDFILTLGTKGANASGIRTKTDPRHTPDWLMSAADVQLGYRRAGLEHSEKECLRHTVHLGFTPGELSSVWGVPSETIHAAVMSGIEKVTRYLNGGSPK